MGTENKTNTMQSAAKVPIADLNEHITCKLCRGYFIDATTIIECLHTFCRSCIIRYLEKNKYCPVCDVQVHKTKPLLNVRPDKTIQDIVYKLVPRLFHNEMQRRKVYYNTHPEVRPSCLEEATAESYRYLLTPEETVSLTLSYAGCVTKPRYFQCPSAVSVGHLKKLICAKYELTEYHKVEVFYNQDCLNPSFSLMDIAYIYSWKGKEPMEFTFKIYESKPKRVKLEAEQQNSQSISSIDSSNNNNWKEVQLRISESGEMSITGIQDASILEILDGDNFKNEVVVNESKQPEESPKKVENDKLKPEEEPKPAKTEVKPVEVPKTNQNHLPPPKKELPGLMLITKTTSSGSTPSKTPVCTSSDNSIVDSAVVTSAKPDNFKTCPLVPVTTTLNCATLSSATTTTVFSTINKTMCSTKSEETKNESDSKPNDTEPQKVKSPALKRKNEDPVTEVPSKVPKPTILNHSIGLMNLSNNHPLKKHSKINRNGEHPVIEKSQSVTVSYVSVSSTKVSANEAVSSKPAVINKTGSGVQVNRPGTPGLAKSVSNKYPGTSLPCYAPKTSYNPVISVPKVVTSQSTLSPALKGNGTSNGDSRVRGNNAKPEVLNSLLNSIRPTPVPHVGSAPPVSHHHVVHHNSFIPHTTPPPTTHFLNSMVAAAAYKSTNSTSSSSSTAAATTSSTSTATTSSIKKLSTPIGYKTLRDPPKSWNSQIAKANMNVKAAAAAAAAASAASASLSNAAATAAGCSGNSPAGKYAPDLKSIRPAKFFKGRNMPRYLGNPASGVKPMYQVHVSPEKDKHQAKVEKSEIKKHSIVKIDPKTLKPISEKAPENTNLSNVSGSLSVSASQNQELRCTSTPGDLKINTSSVSIFNPLKLQSSPKSERKSPKSPHSPKIKNNSMPTASSGNTSSSTSVTLSPTAPKRDKTSLTFTPPNPFVPNLTSPTLSPNQFLYPTGAPPGFPAYDPRVMAAYHSLWYGQRMAAAAAAGFPPPIPGLGLGMGKNPFDVSLTTSTASPQQHSPGVSPKHSTPPRAATPTSMPRGSNGSSRTSPTTKKTKDPTAKSLETALEKLTQSKVKEMRKSPLSKEVSNNQAAKKSVESVPSATKEKVAEVKAETVKPSVDIDETKADEKTATQTSDIKQSVSEIVEQEKPVNCAEENLPKDAVKSNDKTDGDDVKDKQEKIVCGDKETSSDKSETTKDSSDIPPSDASETSAKKDESEVEK